MAIKNNQLHFETKTIAATTINWLENSHFAKSITVDTVFSFSNAIDGKTITIIVNNANTVSNETVSFSDTIRWEDQNGTQIVTSLAIGEYCKFEITKVGSEFIGKVVTNLQTIPNGDTQFQGSSLFIGSDDTNTTGVVNPVVLNRKGQVYAWGGNTQLQMLAGNANTTPNIITTKSYQKIQMLQGTGLGIDYNGDLYAWGRNQAGQVGDGTLTGVTSEKKILTGGRKFKEIGQGQFTSFGIDQNNKLWAWGSNSAGELGDGTTTVKSSPVAVIGSQANSVSIACGIYSSTEHNANGSAFLTTDGFVYTMGDGIAGILGDNTVTAKSSPVSVVGGRTYNYLASGTGNFFAIEQGTNILYGWGRGSNGAIGDNTITNKSSPVSVFSSKSFIKVVSGGAFAVAQATTGELYAWGLGTNGQIGDNTAVSKSTPTSVFNTGGRSWVGLAAGQFASLAIRNDGAMYAWGDQTTTASVGLHGDGRTGTVQANVPFMSRGPNTKSITQIYGSIDAGNGAFAVLLNGDTISVWGNGTSSQQGNGDATSKQVPFYTSGPNVVDYAVGANQAFIKDSNNTVWCCGLGTSGGLGDGTVTTKNVFTTTLNNTNFAAKTVAKVYAGVSTNYARMTDGTMFAWGLGTSGQIGDNTILGKTTPVAVSGGLTFSSFATGYDTAYGIQDSTNALYAWGLGTSGRLGDNTITTKSVPTLTSGARSYSMVAGGSAFFVALEHGTGNAYASGLNTSAQLGDGTLTTKSVPTSVVGGHSFISVACGNSHTLALKANGEVWAWGENTGGKIGDGSVIDKTSPVLVAIPQGKTIVSITATGLASMALASDNTLFTWGVGTNGSLGNDSVSNATSPISINSFFK